MRVILFVSVILRKYIINLINIIKNSVIICRIPGININFIPKDIQYNLCIESTPKGYYNRYLNFSLFNYWNIKVFVFLYLFIISVMEIT